jgi:hypothetical protein
MVQKFRYSPKNVKLNNFMEEVNLEIEDFVFSINKSSKLSKFHNKFNLL